MEQRVVFRISGVLSIFIGLVLLYNSFTGITGLVIIEQIGTASSSIFGLIFLIGGIIILTTVDNIIESAELSDQEKMGVLKSVERHRRKNYETRSRQHFPASLGEAVRQKKLIDYLSKKELVFETNYPPYNYSKHTHLLNNKSLTLDQGRNAARGKRGSQFLPYYDIQKVHEMEDRVMRKGIGNIRDDHHVIFYGKGHSKFGNITGYERGNPPEEVNGLAVDVTETGNKVIIHSYPIHESVVDKQRKKY